MQPSRLICSHTITRCCFMCQEHAPAQAGSAYAERASGFLGACLPRGGALGVPPPGGAAAYGGLVGGAPLARLEAEGLAWVPAWGNALAGLCFALCLVLNEQLMQVLGRPASMPIKSVRVG